MVRIKKKFTKKDVSKIVLETIKTAGLISAALVAPNILVVLKKNGIVDKNFIKRQAIATAKFRLIRDGFLKRDSRGFISLTEKGLDKLRKHEIANYELIVPRFWDRKWRVIIFDIPEYRRYTRAKVRNTLLTIGFYRLQDSVWVFPFDCAELMTLL